MCLEVTTRDTEEMLALPPGKLVPAWKVVGLDPYGDLRPPYCKNHARYHKGWNSDPCPAPLTKNAFRHRHCLSAGVFHLFRTHAAAEKFRFAGGVEATVRCWFYPGDVRGANSEQVAVVRFYLGEAAYRRAQRRLGVPARVYRRNGGRPRGR